MRRLTKEELLKFDGRPLFPERRARTVKVSTLGRRGRALCAVTGICPNRDESRAALR